MQLRTVPRRPQRPPNFHFSVETAADGLHVRGDAFGAGERAVTLVSRVSDEFYLEHALSDVLEFRETVRIMGRASCSEHPARVSRAVLNRARASKTDPERK